MPTVDATNSTKSGITTNADGERHIPASTRADGSVRKEIRVRPGYRPPEDVEVYKNRAAEAWKTRGKGGIPGAEPVEPPTTQASKKNAKRKEARQKDPSAETPKLSKATTEQEPASQPIDPEVEKEKEARKLTKKLRQAKELQQKKDQGDSLLPEQFAKVIKINELLRQLENLGFDAEGNKKDHDNLPETEP